MRLIADAEMTACFSWARGVRRGRRRDTTRRTSRSGTEPEVRTGSCRRVTVLERDGHAPTGKVGQAGDRVGREARLALFAVGDDRRTGRLEAPERVAHGVVVQGVELLGRDPPGGGRLHAVDQCLGPWDAADRFGGECHPAMVPNRNGGVSHTWPDPRIERQERVTMARDEERLMRSQEEPIVGGLPDVPGILAAIRLTPGLGVHLRGLADELLVNDFPGATLERAEREMLATAVSAANDCFYCMDSHGAFANALLERDGATDLAPLIDAVKVGSSEGFDDKMRALLHIARTVRREPRDLTAADIAAAHAAGATDADVQLAVLIAAAFSMYNRMVEGFRARTMPSADAYRARASEIAAHGYSDQRVTSVPR